MNRYFSITLCFCLFFYLKINAQNQYPIIKFDKTVVHYLKESKNFQKENDTIIYRFNFTNTGYKPLIIKYVKSSCTCTIPDYSKEEILPGKKGYIKLKTIIFIR